MLYQILKNHCIKISVQELYLFGTRMRKDNFREGTSAVIFRECIAQPDYVLIQITIGIHARIVLYFNSFVLNLHKAMRVGNIN